MKKGIFVVIIFILSLLLIGCSNNDNKDKGKDGSEEKDFDEVVFDLDGGSWAPSTTFSIDSYVKTLKDDKGVYMISKDANYDNTDLSYFRMFIKEEDNLYRIVDLLIKDESWAKVTGDYDYIILANDNCENKNYDAFKKACYSLKNKNKFLKLGIILDTSASSISLDPLDNEMFVSIYDRIEYAKGLTSIKIEKDEVLEFNPVEKNGYVFNGWLSKDNTYVNQFSNVGDKSNEFKASFSLQTYTIAYYFNGGTYDKELVSTYNIESEDIILPNDITKKDMVFDGWYLNSDFSGVRLDMIKSRSFGNYNLYAKWLKKEIADYTDEERVDYAIEKVLAYYSDLKDVEENIKLVLREDDTSVNIKWQSSNEDVISNTGVYKRDYQDSTVTLKATLSYGSASKDITFDVKAKGFKNLKKYGIKSSYIYRSFSDVDDNFFDTLDIINCAFADANNQGVLTGTNFFKVCKEKIIPEAHKRGCWVVMSIAPSSEWVAIADPSHNLVETFANNIVKAINEYGFDGIDIDWECPTSAQKTWFTNLAKVINQKVKANNPNHIVSAAIGGGRWQPPYYDMANSVKYLDFVNMMTYGMVSSSGQYQNALYKNSSYNDSANKCGYTLVSCSIVESIEIYDSYNVPHEKIIVGLAFYGIKQTRTYDEATKTYGSWGSGKSIFYTSIYNNYLNNPDYTYVYDARCGVPYIISKDKTVFISFDDPKSVKEKCRYVKEHNIGGVMYWENGCDLTGNLLKAIGEVL